MAGMIENPAAWRLRTASGIPYKMKSLSGEFTATTGSGTAEVIIPGNRLIDFSRDCFPPPVSFGLITIPRYTRFQNTNLAILKLDYSSLDDNLPIDPFEYDLLAQPGTYFPALKVSIQFGVPPISTDEKNFLEVTADTTGEFIYAPPTNAEFQGATSGSPRIPNRQPIVPHTILIPQTVWSVKWNQIPLTVFRNVVHPRLEYVMGCVNSKPYSVCFVSEPETLLFAGYSYGYNYGWQNNQGKDPLVDLTMKFVEKRVVWDGRIFGHQDVWRPGYGWDRIFIDGKPTYDQVDYRVLTDPDFDPENPPDEE